MADDDIDPERVDVVTSTPAKRSRRRKPAPVPKSLVEERSKAERRARARPASPGVMLEPRKGGGFTITSPHDDLDTWELQIADAFGSRSQSVFRLFMRQLRDLCSQAYDDAHEAWKPSEVELNAALAMIAGVRPRNELEAALAAQMVAVHWMQMRTSSQALRTGYVGDREAGVAGKLARTFAIQMDTLSRGRGRATVRQNIKVRKETHVHQHQHIHLHGGDVENERQPDATNGGEAAERAALPSPDESGKVVRLPSRGRKASVPDARR